MARNADPMARGFPKAPEPFGATANPGSYIPRPATEEALASLLRSVRGAGAVTVLCGPPGLGKTLLLRLLAARLEDDVHAVFLPYGALSPEDFCAFVLDQLDSPPPEHPVSVLRAYAQHLQQSGSSLLLLIDDAGAMPLESIAWCAAFARAAGGAVQCVFAITDDARSAEVIGSLGSEFERVRLSAPMDLEEAADYVEVQLAVGRVPGAVRDLFDPATVRRLHEASGGVPRQLHTAAQAVLRQEPASPAPEQPPVAERGAAREAVRDSAAAPVAPAIREEIEQLRRAVAGERTPDPPFSPRARLLVGAFALAVVAGLGTAVLRPPSKSAPSEPPPARQQPVRTIPGEAAASLVARDDPKLPAVPQPRAPEDAPMGSDRDPRGPVVSPPLAPEPIAEAEAPTPVGAIAAAPAPVAEGAPPAAGPPVSVNVNATPWATIEVDGETLGETPLAGIALAAGSHTFRATLPDGRIVERVVEIDAENRFVVFDGAPAAPP